VIEPSRRDRRRGGFLPRILVVMRAGLLTTLLLILMAGPALADPAVPTNYRSIVNVVDPQPTGVTVEVVGGDAFLSIAAAEGNTVEVPGYFGEPYLLIDETGAVWLNTRSPARYINQDRYGITQIPPTADAQAAAEWEQVGSGGRFSWHDHRTHWMSPDLPPTIAGDRAEVVFPWSLEITINGIETEVRGELLWFPNVNPVGPLLVGFLGILPLLAYRRHRVRSVAVTAAALGAIALFVSVAQFAATPAFDRGAPADAVIPAVAIAAAVAALWLRESTIRSWAAVALAGIALVWWAATAAVAISAPVLPSALPVFVERAAVSVAIWVGLGLAVIAARELWLATRHRTT
jgi:hypothetical protein